MKFELKKPCKRCPFRNDIQAYLSRDRVEDILDSIIGHQGTFSCHEHNDFTDDGVVEGKRAQHCAGALIFLEHLEKPNQMMRIAERVGMYDRTKLQMDAPVFDNESDFIDAQPR